MKTTRSAIIGAVALLFASAIQTLALEGLKVSVQYSNVVLSWPSVEGETYIVQYRPTLYTNTPWVTLTNSLPAEVGTNWTSFVHSNQVQYLAGGSSGSSSELFVATAAGGDGYDSMAMAAAEPTVPLAMPANGSGDAVPLSLYPPGFDLSGLIIFDPSTGEWLSGSGYIISPLPSDPEAISPRSAVRVADSAALLSGDGAEDPQPEGEGEGGGDPPSYGFYQVVRTGVHLFGITNGMTLSGVVKVPVEIGETGDKLGTLSVAVDGVVIPHAEILSAPFSDHRLIFDLNTGLLGNGTHWIQACAQFISGSMVDQEDDPFTSARGDAIQIEITNHISFPDWQNEFGEDACWFSFTSVYTNIDWRIDIYGTNGNYVGSLTNHSDDGVVDVQWNLVDGNGTTNYDPWFNSVTTVSAGGVTLASAQNPKKVSRPDHFPEQGQWCVARQNLGSGFQNYSSFYFYMDGMTDFGEAHGGVLPGIPPRQSGEAYIIRYGTNVAADLKKQDWDLLKVTVSNSVVRSFFYFGHGTGTKIGGQGTEFGGTNTVFGVGDSMSSEDVATFLHIFDPRHPQYHPYRYVFPDGCETANGNWIERFGIIKKENVPLSYYQKHKIRPSAYSGWSVKNFYAYRNPDRMAMNHAYYISDFAFYWWLTGDTLAEAHDDAYYGNPNPHGVADGMKVFGYANMRHDEYNRAADWP